MRLFHKIQCFGGLVGVVLFLGTMGCQKAGDPRDPKSVLEGYIAQTFAAKAPADRQVLLQALTGEAKARLAAWSDEQFQQAFVDKKRQFVKLAYLEIKSGAQETTITYELTYKDAGKKSDVRVTQRKLARIVRPIASQPEWKIAEVRNIRELIEFENEMSLP